jgi:hypothetical protein
MTKRLISISLFLLALTTIGDANARCTSGVADELVSTLTSQAEGLRPAVLRLAFDAAGCAAERGLVARKDLLTVIDYSLPSTQPRMFVFDLNSRRLLFRELVAHGKNSGDNMATTFSNVSESRTTSLGLFVTGETYYGSNGLSLRLNGLEQGVNDHAAERAIVVHGADYVSTESIRALGRLGRSSGCPAVRPEIAEPLIKTLRGGTPIFSYYPEAEWLASSAFLPEHSTPTFSAGL